MLHHAARRSNHRWGGIVLLTILLGCGSDRRPVSMDAALDARADSASDDASNDSATRDSHVTDAMNHDAARDGATRRDSGTDADVLCDASRCCDPLAASECQAAFHCAAIDDGCGGTLECTGACSGTDTCNAQGVCSSAHDTCPGEGFALGMYLEGAIDGTLDGLADNSHGCGPGDSSDAVYHLKAPRNGRVHARVEAAGFTPVFYVRQRSCSAQILYSCHAPATTFTGASFMVDVEAGVDYYFFVDSRTTPIAGNVYTLRIGYL